MQNTLYLHWVLSTPFHFPSTDRREHRLNIQNLMFTSWFQCLARFSYVLNLIKPLNIVKHIKMCCFVQSIQNQTWMVGQLFWSVWINYLCQQKPVNGGWYRCICRVLCDILRTWKCDKICTYGQFWSLNRRMAAIKTLCLLLDRRHDSQPCCSSHRG